MPFDFNKYLKRWASFLFNFLLMYFLKNKFVFSISLNMEFLKVTFGFALVLNVCVFYPARSDKIGLRNTTQATSLCQQPWHVSTQHVGCPEFYVSLTKPWSPERRKPCWFTVSSVPSIIMHCDANSLIPVSDSLLSSCLEDHPSSLFLQVKP